jgi:hypothetical protein
MVGRVLSGIVAALTLVPGPGRASAEDPALGLADLAAYRAALIDRAGASSEEPVVEVGFRALWTHPQAYQGRRVQVRGRVVRRFRQGPIGTFPALAEVWAVAPSGDPFCLVFPEPEPKSAPEPTGVIRFVGTFLKQVRYQGGDGPRLAPLIVGPNPPALLEPATPQTPNPGPSISWTEAAVAMLAAGFVGLVLARQHLRRPRRPPDPDVEPPPSFVDSTAENADSCST